VILHSLRFRLLALTALVAGASLLAVALASRLAVRHEFQRLETRDRGRGLERAAQLLSDRLQGTGTAAHDSALAGLAAALEQELVLVGADGRVIAASRPDLKTARVEPGPDRRTRIETSDRVGPALVTRRAVIVGDHRARVLAADGSLLGTLYPFPSELDRGRRSETGFLLAVNRWLLLAVVGAGLLAVLLTFALSRRILGPVESLTRAVRRLEGGDRGPRVAVRSSDEIGELARAFNAMADALESQESLRRGLVTDVAHELRTPLTNLRCQIESIQDGLAPADEANIRSLHEETLLLGRLVDDLQDLALVEAGRLPLHRETVRLAPAVDAALAAVRPRATERGVALHAEVAGNPPAADVDPARLAQILRNLLANAITHTPRDGAITVSARAADGAVAIAIQDSGPGIAVEHLPHVFDRFYRADPSRARATGSTGLGLAIVKQLVEAHGGRVRVESEPGHGACFTFTLPAGSS